MTITADVLIAEGFSAEEIEEVKLEFSAIGLSIDLRIVAPKRSLAAIAWLVLVALPLQHFFSHLAEDFADDMHDRLRGLADRVLKRQESNEQRELILVLQDTESATQIILEPNLPRKSYQQLLRLDLSQVRNETLRYDLQQGQWRPEFEENRKTDPRPSHPGT